MLTPEQQAQARHFAREFADFAGMADREVKKQAILEMCTDHHTNQQSMMRFCMQFIEAMANNHSDLRNEASVELAKEIMKIDERVRILPYI